MEEIKVLPGMASRKAIITIEASPDCVVSGEEARISVSYECDPPARDGEPSVVVFVAKQTMKFLHVVLSRAQESAQSNPEKNILIQ